MNRVYSTFGAIEGFDEFFPRCHGIEWPGSSPLITLIRGEAGSGKSTLALQCACLGVSTWAESKERNSPEGIRPDRRPNTSRCVLYYVIDDFVERIKEKCEAFNLFREYGNYDFAVKPLSSDYIFESDNEGPSIPEHLLRIEPASATTYLALIHYHADPRKFDIRRVIGQDVACAVAGMKFQECVVVVDSITPLCFAPSSEAGATIDRTQRIMDRFVSDNPSVIILVDEIDSHHGRDLYLTDVLINLWQSNPTVPSPQSTYCERLLQIVKASNCRHVRGAQKFRICPKQGIAVLPSLMATSHTLEDDVQKAGSRKSIEKTSDRDIDLGPDGLGDMGKIARGSSTVIIGPQGTCKTPMAIDFCREGLLDDGGQGKVVFLSLSDKSDTIRRMAEVSGAFKTLQSNLGNLLHSSDINADTWLDVRRSHRFMIQYLSMSHISPEGFISLVQRMLRTIGHQPGNHTRFVVDALSDLKVNYPRLTDVPAFLSALLTRLAMEQVTSLFVFNDSSYASVADKCIVDLVDNVYRLQGRTIRGQVRVLLEVEELNNNWQAGRTNLFYVGKRSNGTPMPDDAVVRKRDSGIWATPTRGDFYRREDGVLVPAEIHILANQCASSHRLFARRVADVFGVPEKNLDCDLAHGGRDAVKDLLKRLQKDRESAYVVAVDVAYLRKDILEYFLPLDEPEDSNDFVRFSDYPGGDPKDSKIPPLRLCTDDKGSLRVLPVLIDTSVMLCNLNILRSCCEAAAARDGARGGDDHEDEPLLAPVFEQMRGKVDVDDRRLRGEGLPELKLQTVRQAARAFCGLDVSQRSYFFGFSCGPNPEPMVCALSNILSANGVIFRRGSQQKPLKEQTIRRGMLDFATFYLPGPRRAPAQDESRDGEFERKAENCLFYHTWQSLAATEAPEYCVPVKFGPLWRGTRGGWCWGVVNNEIGSRIASDVVQFAAGGIMNMFLISHGIGGIPPRTRMCYDTRVLSVRNLGLMREIVETAAWSRAHLNNYPVLSEFLTVFSHEVTNYIVTIEATDCKEFDRKKDILYGWFDDMKPRITEALRIIGEASTE